MVLEEGHVVGRGFDAKDQAEFVVHLDRGRSHVMADAGAFDTGAEVVAQFVLVVARELASEECRNVLGLDGVDGRARERLVEGSQVTLPLEEDVGGILDLHDAPVVLDAKSLDDRAVAVRKAVESAMQLGDGQIVGELLRSVEVGDAHEGVVEKLIVDALLGELSRQPVVAVEVDLQPEGAPGGDADVAEPELLVDEIEVVVQALARVGLQEGAMGVLVVPGLVRGAGLHGREDVHEAGVIAALGQHLLDAVLLSGCGAAHELDLHPVLLRDALRVVANLVTQRLGPARVVEDADVVRRQVARHAVGEAQAGQRSLHHDPIPAVKDPCDLVGVPIEKRGHRTPSLPDARAVFTPP